MKKLVLLIISLVFILVSCAPAANSPQDNNGLSTGIVADTTADPTDTENDGPVEVVSKKTELLFNKAYDGFYYSFVEFEGLVCAEDRTVVKSLFKTV